MTIQELYIKYIVGQLQSGLTDPTAMVAGFCSNFHKSERTFWNYWPEAKDAHLKDQQLINEQRDKDYITSSIEAQNEAVLNRQEVLEMTSKVVVLAYNQVIESNGLDKSVYAFVAAVDKLNKLEGFEKPAKIANTDSEGKDVAQLNIIAPVGLKLEFPNNTDGADA